MLKSASIMEVTSNKNMVFYTFAKVRELSAKHLLNYLKTVALTQNVHIFTLYFKISSAKLGDAGTDSH